MEEITGDKLIVQSLVEEGVTHAFGLIGSAGMEIFDGPHDEASIRFIGVRDECTGTHMADGYARASGKVGVIIAGQNGPGVTNLVTGLAQAQAAFSPMVTIAGSLSSGHQYRDALQEVDQQTLPRSVLVPSTDRVQELVRDGFRTALTPRQWPVAINVPRDVLSNSIAPGERFSPKGRQLDFRCGPTAAEVEPAAVSRTAAMSPGHGDAVSCDFDLYAG
ncbi:MAG: hypothetical protein MO853_00545 [Candidatus Protistobacter heckmanni]|nr:hypothetical protein [Candidatus Protistobacter heckmanni]